MRKQHQDRKTSRTRCYRKLERNTSCLLNTIKRLRRIKREKGFFSGVNRFEEGMGKREHSYAEVMQEYFSCWNNSSEAGFGKTSKNLAGFQ